MADQTDVRARQDRIEQAREAGQPDSEIRSLIDAEREYQQACNDGKRQRVPDCTWPDVGIDFPIES